MNEKFKLLALEAKMGTADFDAGSYYVATPDKMQKLCELIVLEMCKELDKAQWDKGEDWVCADGTRIIPQIKQHFGVEE
jgi:hypothetical protein